MAEVIFEHVNKSFDTTKVIEDFSLNVADGEFLVLVGPSGCGKSTVLRMLAGLESTTSGDIHIGDRAVNDVAPKDRDIAMVFQNYALYPHMNVYDNMAFGLKMRKTPKAEIEQRVNEVAKLLDLANLLKRKPKQLSGGQRQRVALGRAIVRNPKVFLMDEPLSNLDAKLRVQMRSEIAKLHQRLKVTTLYVTHDQTEAMTMGHRIAILHQGKLQQLDTPLTVYNRPSNLFVAGFIGQMNFLEGTLSTTANGNTFESGDIHLTLPDTLNAETTETVVLGFRPEHVQPATSEAHFSITPDLIEALGHELMVHATVAGQPLIAKLNPDADVTVGTPLPVSIQLQHANLFEKSSGKRLGPIGS